VTNGLARTRLLGRGADGGQTAPLTEDKRAPTGFKLTFHRHQTVFHAGESALRVYEVLDGVLMVFKLLSDGRRQIVEIVPRGWLCGFANHGVYDGSCEALTDATVMAYSRGELEAGDPVRSQLLHQAERQYCALHEHTLTLGRKSAEERLATFLMRFIPGRGRQACDGPKGAADTHQIHVPLTRAEIADYLGLTLETVSRLLTTLAQKGLIRVGPRRSEILINDVCRLCAAAHTGHNE
jgi:CRP-like cAMP-binding protein